MNRNGGDNMDKEKPADSYNVVPVDQSPEGVQELAFILNALLFETFADREVKDEEDEEELKQILREYLARPLEERDAETREIVAKARKRFRELKGK
jgi:hypothetical protein